MLVVIGKHGEHRYQPYGRSARDPSIVQANLSRSGRDQAIGEGRIGGGTEHNTALVSSPKQGAGDSLTLFATKTRGWLIQHQQRRWTYQSPSQSHEALLARGEGAGQARLLGRISHHSQGLARVGFC